MQTLVAHEWIAEVGGSENVFEQIRLTVPHQRAVCLWNGDPDRFGDLEQTWLAASPLRGHKAAAMPFMGSAWRRVDLGGVERVVVSSHAFAHHLASRAAEAGLDAFAYVHSPARYVWVPDLDDRGNSVLGRVGRSYFRRWDRRHVSSRVHYAANSRFVAERMADVWGVAATVIHPPVDVDLFRGPAGRLSAREHSVLESLPGEFILGASRFIPYKNLEAPVRAGEIAGLPVVLAGAGPEEHRLAAIADSAAVPVTFTGRVSSGLLAELYRRAALFVYMPVEDFGIMPVEAMACGTPVVVNQVGGARESVEAVGGGLTAVWRHSRFEDPAVVETALRMDVSAAPGSVAAFSVGSFRSNLAKWLGSEPMASDPPGGPI